MPVIVVTQSGSPATVQTSTESTAPATTTAAGIVKQMPFTAQLTAAPTQADFNALLTKLINAGLMASS
ncbi:hypothetical protein [Dickeya zeae]|uniref:hypothetical protein n=1 Tax=Dickeya zeae TaxID=204042 RepID=UPI0003C7E9AC|nr:hypothetical protein [Dickeya zeae]